MVSDQEPRYRLVDSNGVIRGTLYGKPDGSVAIQETASGADREVALAPDGTFSAPSVETESVSTDQLSIGGGDAGRLIDSASESDGGTITLGDAVDWPNFAMIRFRQNTPSDSALEFRVNGDSSLEHQYITVDSGGISSYEAQGEWLVASGGVEHRNVGVFYIQGSARPTITGGTSTRRVTGETLLRGGVDDVASLSTLDVSHPGNIQIELWEIGGF